MPRPITAVTLLEFIYWAVRDTPAAAEAYTGVSGNVISEYGDTKNDDENNNGQYLGRRDPSKEFYASLRAFNERYNNYAYLW